MLTVLLLFVSRAGLVQARGAVRGQGEDPPVGPGGQGRQPGGLGGPAAPGLGLDGLDDVLLSSLRVEVPGQGEYEDDNKPSKCSPRHGVE